LVLVSWLTSRPWNCLVTRGLVKITGAYAYVGLSRPYRGPFRADQLGFFALHGIMDSCTPEHAMARKPITLMRVAMCQSRTFLYLSFPNHVPYFRMQTYGAFFCCADCPYFRDDHFLLHEPYSIIHIWSVLTCATHGPISTKMREPVYSVITVRIYTRTELWDLLLQCFYNS